MAPRRAVEPCPRNRGGTETAPIIRPATWRRRNYRANHGNSPGIRTRHAHIRQLSIRDPRIGYSETGDVKALRRRDSRLVEPHGTLSGRGCETSRRPTAAYPHSPAFVEPVPWTRRQAGGRSATDDGWRTAHDPRGMGARRTMVKRLPISRGDCRNRAASKHRDVRDRPGPLHEARQRERISVRRRQWSPMARPGHRVTIAKTSIWRLDKHRALPMGSPDPKAWLPTLTGSVVGTPPSLVPRPSGSVCYTSVRPNGPLAQWQSS